jgi:hypothetical protein
MGADLSAMLGLRVLHWVIGKPHATRAGRTRLGGMSSDIDWPRPTTVVQLEQA